MALKITITYYASEEDWDIEQVIDGRSINLDDTKSDLIEMLREDVRYVFDNSEIEIKRTN
jgi:hypothetical protein